MSSFFDIIEIGVLLFNTSSISCILLYIERDLPIVEF
jgi:hypothetical protein